MKQVAKLLSGMAGMLAATLASAPAHAELVLSQVIIDLRPGKPSYNDVEVWNNGTERMYVVSEPSQIQSPGTPAQQRVKVVDPAASGLLVTPQRLVLEPGQRRTMRLAALLPRDMIERIYRVTVKPVAGPVTAETTAVKVLLGYDMLVLVRPLRITGEVTAARQGRKLTFRNASNSAHEIYDGRQCDSAGKECKQLPSTRLYAGASWTVDLPYDTPATYQLTAGNGAMARRY